MASKLIIFLMLAAGICAVISGNTGEFSLAALGGAKNAVELCINISGMIILWSGLMQVAKKTGLVDFLGKVIRPVLKLVFKDVKKGSESENAIVLNISANLLGLGNAATPAGLAAVKAFKKEKVSKRTAAIFITLNCASLQLIPTTVAAIRSAAGAKTPFDILPAVLLTSVCALIFGVSLAAIITKGMGEDRL